MGFIKQHPNPQPSSLPQAWPSTRPRRSSSCKSWSLSCLFPSFLLHPSILLADANQEAGHRRYVRWRRIAEVGGWGRRRFRDTQTKKASKHRKPEKGRRSRGRTCCPRHILGPALKGRKMNGLGVRYLRSLSSRKRSGSNISARWNSWALGFHALGKINTYRPVPRDLSCDAS